MNNILILYTDPNEKSDLVLSSQALKAVFRKFRKSISVSLLNIDLSPSCRSEVKKLIESDAAKADCIMFCGKQNELNEETLFLKDCFKTHSAQYFSSGKCICYPVTTYSVKESEGIIDTVSHTDISAVEKAAALAINSASFAKELLICTDTEKDSDKFIYNEFINSMASARGFSVEHFDFAKMLSVLSEKIPSCNVILTVQDIARILAMHINALNKFPTGYSVFHGDKVRIYKKAFLPCEDFSNISYASLLIGCAGMIENELGFKNISIQLRKAVTRSLEKCAFESKHDFQRHLLIEINSPIRHRQVKTNEGNN